HRARRHLRGDRSRGSARWWPDLDSATGSASTRVVTRDYPSENRRSPRRDRPESAAEEAVDRYRPDGPLPQEAVTSPEARGAGTSTRVRTALKGCRRGDVGERARPRNRLIEARFGESLRTPAVRPASRPVFDVDAATIPM